MDAKQIEAARVALNELDDCARMDTGVDAAGPRGVLESFIALVEALPTSTTAEKGAVEDRAEFEKWAVSQEGGWSPLALQKIETAELHQTTGDYADDDVQAEWRAWQAGRALLAAQPVAQFTDDDIDRFRQYFDNVQDVNPAYLNEADFMLAKRLYEMCGMRVPNSITERQPVASKEAVSAADVLAAHGVFRGADGLQRFAEANNFWEEQPYGTRLYFGPHTGDYLHREVLRTAVQALTSAPQVAIEQPASPTIAAEGVPEPKSLITDADVGHRAYSREQMRAAIARAEAAEAKVRELEAQLLAVTTQSSVWASRAGKAEAALAAQEAAKPSEPEFRSLADMAAARDRAFAKPSEGSGDVLNLIVRDVAELDYSSDVAPDLMQVSEADLRLIIERHRAALAQPAEPVTAAARDVLAERARQISAEGWTPERDDGYVKGDLAKAAACYALHTEPVGNVGDYLRFWPWVSNWWKPADRRRNMVKAGALILAEIERIDRAERSAK